jgi:hypothetical protein
LSASRQGGVQVGSSESGSPGMGRSASNRSESSCKSLILKGLPFRSGAPGNRGLMAPDLSVVAARPGDGLLGE